MVMKRILLIEDTAHPDKLVRSMIADAGKGEFEVVVESDLETAETAVGEDGIELVVLDLDVPEHTPVQAMERVLGFSEDYAILILTGLDDKTTALEAIRRGAQDYLVKGEFDARLLIRAMRYAIERHRLLSQLQQAQRREAQQRELAGWQRLATLLSSGVAGRYYSARSLAEEAPGAFDEAVERHLHILGLSIDEQIHRVDHKVRDRLRTFAEELGRLRATPRDLIEIHSRTLEKGAPQSSRKAEAAYIDEARMILVQAMGYLASFYRRLAFSHVHEAVCDTCPYDTEESDHK